MMGGAQGSTAAVLLRALRTAAEETHTPRSADGTAHANGDAAALPKHLVSSLARLGASLRRLCLKDDVDFDEDEYTEAAAAVRMAAIKVAGQTRCAHTFHTQEAGQRHFESTELDSCLE